MFLLFRFLALMGRAALLWLRVRPFAPHARWLLKNRPYLLGYRQEWRKINALIRSQS